MKKLIPIILAALCALPLFAAAEPEQGSLGVQQIMIPHQFFVGDTVILRYMFSSPVDFFSGAEPERVSGDILIIDETLPAFAQMEDQCTVKKVTLERSGISYTMNITLVPWITGQIDFESFDLHSYCASVGGEAAVFEEGEFSGFIIDLEPFTVASITDHLDAISMRPPAAPLLLPGTNYVVWLLILAGIVLLIITGLVIAEFPSLIDFFLSLKERIGFIRNLFATRRKLRRLLKEKCDDDTFARSWQQIMRSYLSFRFATPFAAVTSARIPVVIKNLTGDLMTEAQEEALYTLRAFFTRTDYIIFAAGSIESKLEPAEEHKAAFLEAERDGLVDQSLKIVSTFEAKNESEEVY